MNKRLNALVLGTACAALAACGGGFEFPDISASDFSYKVATAYRSAIYETRQYELDGSDSQGGRYRMTLTLTDRGPDTLDGIATTRVERAYTVVSLDDGGEVSHAQTVWYDGSDRPLFSRDSDGVETTYHTWTTLPVEARTGASGELYRGDASDGTHLQAFWSLGTVSRYQAVFTFETAYQDSAGSEIGFEEVVYNIDISGRVTLREIRVQLLDLGVTVTFE